jgi:hypothetical protein
MTFQEAHQQLQSLHDELCLATGRGEYYWMRMASEYRVVHGGTLEYDKSFKRRYYNNAEDCKSVSDNLRKIPIPSKAEGIASFMTSIKRELFCFPRTLPVMATITGLVENLEQIASLFQE